MTKRFYVTSIVALATMLLPLALFATAEAESAMTIPEGIDLVTPERIGNPERRDHPGVVSAAGLRAVLGYGSAHVIPAREVGRVDARAPERQDRARDMGRGCQRVLCETGSGSCLRQSSGRRPDARSSHLQPVAAAYRSIHPGRARRLLPMDARDHDRSGGRQDQADQVQHRDRRPLVPARPGTGAASFLRRADRSCQERPGSRNREPNRRGGQIATVPSDLSDVVFPRQELVRRGRTADLREHSGRQRGDDRDLRRLQETRR